ncbi:MAG: hypothetical protein IPI81_09380 [Flavobacteriales bacterium]|nr:hypothetical protein [Flavobacteriales bacterium]
MRSYLLFLAMFPLCGLYAQFSILDETFSGDGMITTDLGSNGGQGNAMVALPDGGFFVAGEAKSYEGSRFALLKYLENGTLDGSFGASGVALAPFAIGPSSATSMALQPDGRIVLAGTVWNGTDYDIAAARFLADGSLDPSFSNDGLVTITILAQDDRATGVVQLPDGRIVIGGTMHNGSDEDFATVCLMPDGSIDPTFGSSGIRILPIGSSYDIATALGVQPDGRILQAGYYSTGTYTSIAIARLFPDGTLDASFGDQGIVHADIGPYSEKAYAIALQSDGKVVVAGSTYSVNEDFVALRLNVDGSLDATFGNNGVANVGPTTQVAKAVCIGADGRIYLTGYAWWGLSPHTPVVCMLPNGVLDPSFSGNGHVIVSFALGSDEGRAIMVQPNGRVVVAGYAANDLRSTSEISLFRLGDNALPDPEFGTNGRVTTTAEERMDVAYALAIQPDGRTLLAGRSSTNGIGEMALVRHSGNGNRDVFFGTAGRVRLNIGIGDAGANALAVRPDGRILVGGYASNGNDRDIAIAGLLTNGVLDTTFGTGGMVIAAFGAGDDVAQAMRLDASGRLLVAGSSFIGSNEDMIIARSDEDGALDPTFGTGGWTGLDLGNDEIAYAMALQSDGRIIAAGSTGTVQDRSVLVVRLDADGALDPSFGDAGVAVLDMGTGDHVALAVVVDAQQRIVVTGRTSDGDNENVLIARLATDGTLDPTFGNGGWVSIGSPASDESANSILVRPDGTVLVCGYIRTDTIEDFLLVRVQPNGALDPGFFQDGLVTVDIGEGDDRAYAMALQQDGGLVVGGSAVVSGTDDFAIIRFAYPSIVMNADAVDAMTIPLSVAPDPCMDQATAVFDLPKEERITLQLLDARGVVVRVFLSNELRPQGRSVEELGLAGLAAGRYQLVLRSKEYGVGTGLIKQ